MAQEIIGELIDNNKVVIFSKSYCPYCKLAKSVFDEIDQKFIAIELDTRSDGEEIQTVLGKMTGAKT